MLLSVDWDYFVGTAEWVFDSPFWGTPDREYHREGRWRELARKRDPQAAGFMALEADFPLLADPQALLAYRGVPAYAAQSHDSAWGWLEMFPAEREVLNLDSHHDLYSQSGDPDRLRPGNWAGLALRAGRIERYRVRYPEWHAGVRVCEGFDLERTRDELVDQLDPPILKKVSLERGSVPPGLDVTSLLVVQSPAWTNPLFDPTLFDLLAELKAEPLSPLLCRQGREF